eukprot:scaffold64282_cov63-Phaeocystis_antarctica.AAC.2
MWKPAAKRRRPQLALQHASPARPMDQAHRAARSVLPRPDQFCLAGRPHILAFSSPRPPWTRDAASGLHAWADLYALWRSTIAGARPRAMPGGVAVSCGATDVKRNCKLTCDGCPPPSPSPPPPLPPPPLAPFADRPCTPSSTEDRCKVTLKIEARLLRLLPYLARLPSTQAYL